MEFGLREWMIVIGVLLILGVVLDGFRRMRQSRNGRIRMSLKPVPGAPAEDDELLSSELPAGGARVRYRGDDDTPSLGQRTRQRASRAMPWSREAAARRDDDEDDISLIDPVPLLMDSIGLREDVVDFDQPSMSAVDDDEPQADLWAEEKRAEKAEAREASAKAYGDEHTEVLVINMLAKDRKKGISGSAIMRVFPDCDIRFGEMNIFHRHEEANGVGPIQFSVANLEEPGSFDLGTINDITTRGMCFFMRLPGPERPMEAFEAMAGTAQLFVKYFGGELRDQHHSVMTPQTLEHCRQRIRDFERRRRLAR